ncbi:unnamed protein product [Colias eurytheme]|nr:unnamed protein product [Colias eurytheme]
MVRFCAVYGCFTADKYDANRRFFTFPSDEAMCLLWLRVVGRWDLAEKPIATLSKSYYVCDLHFKSTDLNIKKLKRSAVPSFNLPDLSGAKNPEKSIQTEEKETNEASTQTDSKISRISHAEKSTQTNKKHLLSKNSRKMKLQKDLRKQCKKRKVFENQLECVTSGQNDDS